NTFLQNSMKRKRKKYTLVAEKGLQNSCMSLRNGLPVLLFWNIFWIFNFPLSLWMRHTVSQNGARISDPDIRTLKHFGTIIPNLPALRLPLPPPQKCSVKL